MFQSDTHIDLHQPEILQDEAGKAQKITRTQILAALAVSMGSMIVGFSSAWSSPAIASLTQPESSLEVTSNEASWIGSMLPLGPVQLLFFYLVNLFFFLGY